MLEDVIIESFNQPYWDKKNVPSSGPFISLNGLRHGDPHPNFRAGIVVVLHFGKRSFEMHPDYLSILRVFNNKGLLYESETPTLCGVGRNDAFLNFVLGIPGEKSEERNQIIHAVKSQII